MADTGARPSLQDTAPALRPLRALSATQLAAQLATAYAGGDGALGAHCIHEQWMRGEIGINIDHALDQLWRHAADSIPDWLPMRHFDCLATLYDVAAQFTRQARGRSNLYLVLLDYRDSRPEPFGIYVGMSHYSPAQRFDQHKSGIRAAGSVLRRGLEVLTGPTQHLQRLARTEAEALEVRLADALRYAGLFVQGGH